MHLIHAASATFSAYNDPLKDFSSSWMGGDPFADIKNEVIYDDKFSLKKVTV